MYHDELVKIFDKLNDSQKILVEEIDEQGIDIQDDSFEKTISNINEEDKNAIIQYYKDKAVLQLKFYFNSLDEYEKGLMQEILSKDIKPGNQEFNQLLMTRIVNINNIYRYFDFKKREFLLDYNKSEIDFINQMIENDITIDSPEFDEIINKANYDRNKIINYYNNINWINNTTNYFTKNKETVKPKIESNPQKDFLINLKNRLEENKNLTQTEYNDEDIKKYGFIDIFSISIVTIIVCTILTLILTLFK